MIELKTSIQEIREAGYLAQINKENAKELEMRYHILVQFYCSQYKNKSLKDISLLLNIPLDELKTIARRKERVIYKLTDKAYKVALVVSLVAVACLIGLSYLIR